nr:alpha/beta fold hydrolase [Halomonas rituensis]
MMSFPEPLPLTLCRGRLAALAWGDAQAPVWLALHGWLDNAASFSRLAPRLATRLGVRIVALDFRGHGLSRSAPEGADYALWDYCHDLLDAMEELGVERAPLLAHSMGAAVACLIAAAFPERTEKLILLDGLGSLSTPAIDTPAQLRKGLVSHRRPLSRPPRYPDLDTAIAARVAGGVTPIDFDTAAPLVERNLALEEAGDVRLRSDSRLLKPSLVRFSPEQVNGILAAIVCPVLLIEGESGILGERASAQQARRAVKHLTRHVMKGGHHLHLEKGVVDAVTEVIEADHQTALPT